MMSLPSADRLKVSFTLRKTTPSSWRRLSMPSEKGKSRARTLRPCRPNLVRFLRLAHTAQARRQNSRSCPVDSRRRPSYLPPCIPTATTKLSKDPPIRRITQYSPLHSMQILHPHSHKSTSIQTRVRPDVNGPASSRISSASLSILTGRLPCRQSRSQGRRF